MRILTIDDVKQLVNRQLDTIEDELVRSALETLLVDPFSQDREFYGDMLTCWAVAEHLASGTRYVYCEEGFGTSSPWGIVSASGLEMGMDSGWFKTLDDAFYESFASAPLNIWNVVNRNITGKDRVVATSLTLDESDDLIAKLNAKEGTHAHSRTKYCAEPRTKTWW